MHGFNLGVTLLLFLLESLIQGTMDYLLKLPSNLLAITVYNVVFTSRCFLWAYLSLYFTTKYLYFYYLIIIIITILTTNKFI